METVGPGVRAYVRRLALDRSRAAKADFDHIFVLGIIEPSESDFASPLHMVHKKYLADLLHALSNVAVVRHAYSDSTKF